MATKYHTIIFVPHARARFRKFKLSNRALASFGALLVLGSLFCAYFSYHFFVSISQTREIVRIRSENEQLRSVNTRFESSMATLQSQISQFESKTRKLAIIAGLTDESGSALGGVGGLDSSSRSDLDPAGFDTTGLGHRLELIEDRFAQQTQTLAHTPTIAPTRGILTNGFGMRRDPFDGGDDFHQALDISTAAGNPIVAPADGVVTLAEYDGSYGNSIVLSHGYGFTTRYGHLMRFNCKIGQQVKRGQVIGTIGSTGRSTGPHLHYEVRIDNRPVNPLAYILTSF